MKKTLIKSDVAGIVAEKCFNKWKLKQNTCPICRNDNKTIRKKENNNNKLYRVKLSFLILILAIYFNNFNISKTTDIILTEIKRSLKREERVEIRGWGSLSIRNQKSTIIGPSGSHRSDAGCGWFDDS